MSKNWILRLRQIRSNLKASNPSNKSVNADWFQTLNQFYSLVVLGKPQNLTLVNVTHVSHNTSTAIVTWLPPSNITYPNVIQEYNISWRKAPILRKQTSEPHFDSVSLPPVSFNCPEVNLTCRCDCIVIQTKPLFFYKNLFFIQTSKLR